jgi:hypothetical protein
MTNYYQVQGTIEDSTEILFGSFDRSECKDEIECEKSTWKSEGYKKITIVITKTNEKPDPTVYENLVSKEDLKAFVKSENEGSIIDYIADGLITKSGDSFLINDTRILADINMIRTGLLTSKQLWMQQAPSFNFELDEKDLLKLALKKGFVIQPDQKIKLYKINEEY